MGNFKKWFLFAALGLSAFYSSAQSCSHAIRLVVLGSSTSAGVGASIPDSAYVNLYARFLIDSVNASSTIINLAYGGYTTYAMQPSNFIIPANRTSFPVDNARNITKALSLLPDGILINYPSNDAAYDFTLQEQQENFTRVVSKADSANIPVWITTTQPRNYETQARKQSNIDMRTWIIATYPDRYIEFYEGFVDSTNFDILPVYDSGDGVHLNDRGHRLLFERVRASKLHTALCNKNTLGLADVQFANNSGSASILPNPVLDSEETVLTLSDAIDEDLELIVFNSLGTEAASQKLTTNGIDNKASIQCLNTLTAGVYFLQFCNAGKQTTLKVMKQ